LLTQQRPLPEKGAGTHGEDLSATHCCCCWVLLLLLLLAVLVHHCCHGALQRKKHD
jgi:hypothetical protein